MKVMDDLTLLASGFSGTMGLWARSLTTGEVVEFGDAHAPFSSASTIKLAIFYELYRQAVEGKVDLDSPWTMTAEDQVPGSGVLKDLSPGINLPIRDLATLMMTISDNTASNLCIDVVDGLATVNPAMDQLGLGGLRLHNKFFKAVPGRPGNQAVPAHLGGLLDRIARREVLTPEACDEMIGVMKRVQSPLIPRFFPEYQRLQKVEGEDEVVVAAKYGSITGCRHEVGAVWKGDQGYVIAVMTRGCADPRYHEDNEGQLLVGKAAAAVHAHFMGQ